MIAELVRRLIDAGCDPAVAAEVVTEARDLGADVRDMSGTNILRAYERERKRRYRSNVPGHVRDKSTKNKQNHEVNTGTNVRDKPAQHIEGVSKNLRIDKAQRLSGTWSLPEACRVWTLSKGLTEQEIAEQSERFRDYWTAKGGKDACKTDWVATWRNWIRNTLERQGKPATPDRVNGKQGDARYGWKPGLPTSEELRAKYAKETV